MSLTKNEKEKILNLKKTSVVWTKAETIKLIEARNMGATPMILFNAKIFPGKTYTQIRDKCREIK